MTQKRKLINNENGFTLVELMVTVLLTAIAVVAIYRGYTSFSQGADAQQQVMEMQQNLRIGMNWLAADIRRAGMNEEYEDVAGFIKANETYIEFSMDISNGGVFKDDGIDNDDDAVADDNNPATDDDEALEEDRIGDVDVDDDGERIRYYISEDFDGDFTLDAGEDLNGNGMLDTHEDFNGNGKLDPGEDLNGNGELDSARLMRAVWQGGAYVTQTIITNVEGIDFRYWDAGSATTAPVPLGFTYEDPPGSGIMWLDPDDELTRVDKVEITLVVRTTNEDYRYTDVGPYENLVGVAVFTPGADDHYRRRAFTMVVQIRNNI